MASTQPAQAQPAQAQPAQAQPAASTGAAAPAKGGAQKAQGSPSQRGGNRGGARGGATSARGGERGGSRGGARGGAAPARGGRGGSQGAGAPRSAGTGNNKQQPRPAGTKSVKPAGTKPAIKPTGAKPAQKPAGSKAAGAKSASGAAGAKPTGAKPAQPGQKLVQRKKKPGKKRVVQSVQTFGKKKTAIAVAYTCEGVGIIKINGSPIELVEPQVLRYKVFEPVLLLGNARFSKIDIRIRVQGGGHVSQIYAIRQALAKAIVAYYQKYVDESEKQKIKDILMDYDRSLLAIDARRCEPKKFGGRGARARFQKSYR